MSSLLWDLLKYKVLGNHVCKEDVYLDIYGLLEGVTLYT